MNSAEFIKYITTPLTKEEMHLLYKANNIKYDKCRLYGDFIITLNKLVVNTFLGDDVIHIEEDIKSHFNGEERIAKGFLIVKYNIPKQCTATYFPEANVLIPLKSVAKVSNTPASKTVIISIVKR